MTRSDLRDQPAYTMAEAARYLKVAVATLRSWVVGRTYPKSDGEARFHPLIHPPALQPPVLSFWNLIEAHVLRALRTEHGVSMEALRNALAYAEKSLKIKRLLLSQELRTEGGVLLLERYGELIDLTKSGQIVMKKVFEEHLKRIEWDKWEFPVRLYPFLSNSAPRGDHPVAIDPEVAFGRPIITGKGISTGTIAERIDAGESVPELAVDYDLSSREIEDALFYERAA